MTYYINFALDLKRDNSNIIYYDSGLFTDKPISVSTPVVTEIIKKFTEEFKNVGIVIKNEDKHFFKSLSGEALICKVQDLDGEYLDKANKDIAEKLSTCLSKITVNNLYSEELVINFSEVKEIIELRNYLFRYVITKKKNFQKGYMVIIR